MAHRHEEVFWLIRAGSVGVVSGISSLFLSFVDHQFATPAKMAVLGSGIMIILLLARSKKLDRWTRPMIERALGGTGSTELRDYAGLAPHARKLAHQPDQGSKTKVGYRIVPWPSST